MTFLVQDERLVVSMRNNSYFFRANEDAIMKKLPKLKQFSIALGLCTMAFGLNAAKPVPPPDTNLVSNLIPVADAKNVFSKYSQLIAQSDISGLSKGDQKALGYIVEAAKVMDRIF